MVLPVLIPAIIATLVSLFGIGTISTFIPSIGNFIWGGLFILAAMFLPKIAFIKTDRIELSLSNIVGTIGVAIVVMALFNVNIQSFFSSIIQPIPTGSVFDSLKESFQSIGIKPISLTVLITIISSMFIAAFYFTKRDKRRKK